MKRVRIGDIDGDGWKDIIVGSQSENDGNLFIFLNNTVAGSLSFVGTPEQITVLGAKDTGSLIVGDLDNDGRPDIVTSSTTNSDNIFLLKNISSIGSVSFEPRGDIGSGRLRINLALADLNRDGFNDIIATRNNGIEIFENNGNFDFTDPSTVTDNSIDCHGLDVGDMNGDGWPDVAVGSLLNHVVYFENQKSETISMGSAILESTGPFGAVRNIRIADLDADGRPDLSFSHNSVLGAGDFRILMNDICMTPALNPTSGIYCTNSNFTIQATQGHDVEYQWTVSGPDPGDASELNLNGYSGQQTINVQTTMASGCINTSENIMIEHDPGNPPTTPTINTSANSVNLCANDEFTLTTTASETNYNWYGPSGYIETTQTSNLPISVSVDASYAGSYYLTVDDGSSCQSEASSPILITVSSPPVVNPEIGTCTPQGIDLVAPDYTNEFDYQWKRDNADIAGSVGASITVSEGDTYTLEISDANNCTQTSNTIIIPDLPMSSFDGPSFGTSDEVCVGTMITFSATSTGADGSTLGYNWTIEKPGPTEPTTLTENGIEISSNFEDLGMATVTLETYYTDGIGCDFTEKMINVTGPKNYSANESIADLDGASPNFQKCPGNILTLSFSQLGTDIATGTVSWDSLGITLNNDMLDITESGEYTGFYTTSTGCEEEYSITVENYPDLGLEISDPSGQFMPIFLPDKGQVELEDGQLSVLISTERQISDLTWSLIDGMAQTTDNGTGFEVSPESPQVTIQAMGTTDEGCMETETILITGGSFPARRAFSPDGIGENNCWSITNSSILEGCKVYILDSRGKHIFEQDLPSGNSENPDCIWDGTSANIEVPEGIYYFVMKCSNSNRNQTGSILLARKK